MTAQPFVEDNIEEALSSGIDYIVIGEGEETIKESENALPVLKEIKGKEIKRFELNEEEVGAYNKSDEISAYNETSFMRTGNNSNRKDRPNLFYPIYYNAKQDKLSLKKKTGYIKILPINQTGEEKTWRWGKETFLEKCDTELFVREQVVGRSMEPTIRDGSYCIFRYDQGGSRNGKVVLVESRQVTDPETNQKFTLKRYRSEKEALADDQWRHKKIILSPDNKAFKDIVLKNVSGDDFHVVAEFYKNAEDK